MLTSQLGILLRDARKALGLRQKDAARRAKVSNRLWAEVERGERPNVSLATALRMLSEVGISIRLGDPRGTTHELRDPGTEEAARAARAMIRRATWTGRQIRLAEEGMELPGASMASGNLADVGRVSAQAFTIARAQRVGR